MAQRKPVPALTGSLAVWRPKMDGVNACISANAEGKELVDQPLPEPGVVRVAGSFSMEGVIGHEQGPDDDSPIGGAPDGPETFDGDAASAGAVTNAKAHLDKVMPLLKASGVDFAGFGFDAAVEAGIDEATHPQLRLHMALVRPDVVVGGLLKAQPGNQLFIVFSAPRAKPPVRRADGQFTVELEGMDVYDPVSNALFPTSRDRIAAWFVDTDYDGRSFCILQAFFPDRRKWDKLARALGDKGVVDEGRLDALSGFEGLAFARPSRLPARAPWRVAVKVIDPRGNEGLRVLTMPE